MLESVTECCRVLQSVAECYRVLQSVAECYRVLQSISSASTWTNFWAFFYKILFKSHKKNYNKLKTKNSQEDLSLSSVIHKPSGSSVEKASDVSNEELMFDEQKEAEKDKQQEIVRTPFYVQGPRKSVVRLNQNSREGETLFFSE